MKGGKEQHLFYFKNKDIFQNCDNVKFPNDKDRMVTLSFPMKKDIY